VITSGLKAGEKVVVEGIQKVKAGQPVAAKPWTPPAQPSAEGGASTKTAAQPEAK
jgi:membrane fusion protein (multidrug efflux system)